MYCHRVNACIKYGWNKTENSVKEVVTTTTSIEPKYPENGWNSLTDLAALGRSLSADFNMSHIVAYFVTRTVKDSLPAGDFKSINKSAENLFRCGHVQNIQLASVTGILYIKSNCLPEMRRDRVYCVRMALRGSSCDIIAAECGCPAGRGPNGSCKHIGALSYALADFVRFKTSPEYQTCTDKLQVWNRPRARKVQPIPVDQLGDRRRELAPSKVRAKGSQMIYDPRPLNHRKADTEAIEKLRCDLLSINKPCAFSHILIPSVGKIKHDHMYGDQVHVSTLSDFCVFTLKGVGVQRIYADDVWQKQICPQLDDYFFEEILPELQCPQCKPSYYL